MQVQVHFVFQNEEEFLAFTTKYNQGTLTAANALNTPSPKAAAKAQTKEPTFEQKMKAKEAEEKAEPEAATNEPQVISFDAVKDAVRNLSLKKGRDAAVAALDKFGYKKVGADMKEEDYGKVILECNRLLEA